MGSTTVQQRHQHAARAPSSLLQLQTLEQELQETIQAVEVFGADHLEVANLTKLTRRMRSDLHYVQLLSSQDSQQLTEPRMQGIVNNLRGFRGELMALQEAPSVVAVCRKFKAPVAAAVAGSAAAPAGTGGWQDGQQGPLPLDDPRAWRSDSSSRSRSSSSASSCSSGGGSADSDAQADPTACSCTCAREPIHNPHQQQHQHQQHQHQQQRAAPAAAATALGSSDALAAGPHQHGAQGEVQVEVDVVADGGLTWIEVKNQEIFGLASGHFTGGAHAKGLDEQVQQLLAVSRHPRHRRRGLAPQVVVFFPSGVDGDVAAALQGLGAKVAAGPGSLAPLCGLAVPNTVTNLDVTALCALVSQASWGNPSCEELRAWAARTTHWQSCLEMQQQSPLLPELQPLVAPERQLVVSCAAVRQFQTLMDAYSGPLEQQRWRELLSRLQVHHCHSGTGSSSSGCGCMSRAAAPADQQQQLHGVQVLRDAAQAPRVQGGCEPCVAVSQRLQALPKLSPLQRAVFGLGDALHALTITANGSAVRSVAASGLELDVQLHRPVWLTGL